MGVGGWRWEVSRRPGWGNQTEVWHPRGFGDSLEGNEFQVVDINDSRLDTILHV